ncbi:hypothetical protein KKA15_06580 [Patescibacteria group bacterium]|nr:hypothetical protein [Patescibacteria group bacterium]
MNPSKVKKFTRAKNLDPTKVEEFINGAEPEDNAGVVQPAKQNSAPESITETKPSPSFGNSTPTSPLSTSPADDTAIPKYPWDDANDRVIKGVNLRLTEVQWAKLRFIVDNTPFSIQKYIMNLLEPAMEETIKKIQDALNRS